MRSNDNVNSKDANFSVYELICVFRIRTRKSRNKKKTFALRAPCTHTVSTHEFLISTYRFGCNLDWTYSWGNVLLANSDQLFIGIDWSKQMERAWTQIQYRIINFHYNVRNIKKNKKKYESCGFREKWLSHDVMRYSRLFIVVCVRLLWCTAAGGRLAVTWKTYKNQWLCFAKQITFTSLWNNCWSCHLNDDTPHSSDEVEVKKKLNSFLPPNCHPVNEFKIRFYRQEFTAGSRVTSHRFIGFGTKRGYFT